MNKPYSHSHRTADGTIWTFLAEALILPTGLISAAYLTRALGPDRYGLFSLAATLMVFAGSVTGALLNRGSIKLVSEADDWQPVATTIVRIHVACGIATTLIVALLARPTAVLLEEPRLTFYLILFALEPLLSVLSRAHRSVLIGTGRFRAQAGPVAMRLVARLVLIIVFVESGLSVTGAVLGIVGSSLVELVAYRRHIRPRMFPGSGYPTNSVWHEARPIFFASLCLAFLGRVDLLALTALGLPTSEAGYYGAAQNLSIVPGLFAVSFTPLLLSSLSGMTKRGEHVRVRNMSRDAMRLVFGMLPFAALASGSSHEVVLLIFGPDFAPAGPILSWLIVGKVAGVMTSISFITLIVAGRARLSGVIAGLMLVLGIAGHILFIPRFGSMGAAWVTSGLEIAGALAGLFVVYRLQRVLPPTLTIIRTLLVAGGAWLAAAFWPVAGMWVVAKLVLIALGIAATYMFLGEFKASEIAWARTSLRRTDR